MNFFKNVMAVLVGLFLFGILSFFGMLILFGAIAASSDKSVLIEDNSVLLINLKGELHEQVPKDDPFQQLFNEETPFMGVLASIKAIEEASSDDRIKGIYINSGFFSGGYASLRELREAIIDFKASGKFVYAYGEFYTEKGYYLASVADKIFIHPQGSMEFNGLSANVTFLKGGLDKLGIEPQIFRAGDFKGAVEPFIRKDLSAENRLQLEEWLQSLNGNLIAEIAEARNMTKEEVTEISNSMLVTNTDDALKYKLVTDLVYSDQVKAEINQTLGAEDNDDINFVSTDDYYKTWFATADLPSDRIAVVVAEGEILSGEGNNYQVGSKKFVSAIRKLREDENVKAMIIRVNSPGGGMTASDAIWREITLAKEQMPVIASMSDYAASGGYYLAMPCDTIVSHPTTLTGSIGVFGMLFNFGPFLNNKLGITHDVVRTGEFSDIFTVTRSLSDQEREIIQKEVMRSYNTFLEKAAEGRSTEKEQIAQVASGRIWSGTMALENGLVDVLGDFNDALEIAAGAADLEEYRVVYYPAQKSVLEELLEDFGMQAKIRIFGSDLDILGPYAEIVEKVKGYEGIQARMPYEVELR